MKFALIGYGKMGKTIEQVILEQAQDARHKTQDSALKSEVTLKITDENLADFTAENLRKADVAIEFTSPHAAVDNIYKCFDAGIPVVVGTTAWLDRLEEVKKRCAEKNGALFYSPNFSIGVNIFWEVNRRLAQLMNTQPQYEVILEEIHHTEKLDAPSGTAIKTAEVIMEELKRKTSWKLHPGSYQDENLLIVAKREANMPGTHTVTYSSEVDFIQVKHEAKNRRGFAEGAVMAARWMVGKSGVYEMKDLLKI